MISVPFLSCAHSRTPRPERFRRRPRYLGGVLAAVAAAGLPACDVDVQSLRVVGVYVPGETPEPIMPETATAGGAGGERWLPPRRNAWATPMPPRTSCRQL